MYVWLKGTLCKNLVNGMPYSAAGRR